jgi:hypothetical protein
MRLLLTAFAVCALAAGPAIADDTSSDSSDTTDQVLSALDDTTSCDTSSDSTDDTSTIDFGTRAGDGTDDPSDDPAADDSSDDSTSDDSTDTSGDCSGDDAGSDVTVTAPSSAGAGKVAKAGKLSASYDLPDAATIDAQLVSAKGIPAPTKGHRHAKLKLLGTAHKEVADAGTASVDVKLTKRARKAIAALHKPVKVVLKTTIELADGTIVKHTKTITLSPGKTSRKG